LRRIRDELAYALGAEQNRGLADLLFAFGKVEYSDPRGAPPASRISCRPVP